jgi:PleD family two-component response regulator
MDISGCRTISRWHPHHYRAAGRGAQGEVEAAGSVVQLCGHGDGMSGHVLIVDDEEAICTSLKGILSDEGYEVSWPMTATRP